MNKLTQRFLKLAAVAAPAIIPTLATPTAKADPVTFSTFMSFNNTSAIGCAPRGGINYDPYTNSLVGTTEFNNVNGVIGNGSLYTINLTTGAMTNLSFGTPSFSGIAPDAPVLSTPAGYYFNTQLGGPNNNGVLGFMPRSGGVLSAYYNSDEGTIPEAGPALGADGRIYTLTSNNSAISTVDFTGGTGTFTTVSKLQNSQSSTPIGLTAHSDSLYYVEHDDNNNGLVTAYNTKDQTVKTITIFNDPIDPIEAPQFDAAGNMYVMALNNTNAQIQTDFYKITPGATTPQKLLSLDGIPVGLQYGDTDPFLVDGNGNQFFIFQDDAGGPFDNDTGHDSFDELSANGVLTSTPLPSDISYPNFLLAYNPNDGLVYGTSQRGGSNHLGTIFTVANSGYQNVPEPTNLALLGIAAVGLLGRRRHEPQPTLSI